MTGNDEKDFVDMSNCPDLREVNPHGERYKVDNLVEFGLAESTLLSGFSG